MALRNLITDIPGLRVGHAGDAKLGSGVDGGRVRRRRGGERGRARRRAGHARDRPARSGADGGRHRRHRAVGRLGLRARCRLRRAGLAARAGPRLPDPRRAWCRSCRRAIMFDLLNGGDKNWGRYPPYRELGYEAAKTAGADFALGSVGAGTRRDHRDAQGRRRLGLGARRATASPSARLPWSMPSARR